LDTCHPDILYFREQGCEYPWLFFDAKRGPRAKKFWEQWTEGYELHLALSSSAKLGGGSALGHSRWEKLRKLAFSKGLVFIYEMETLT
jgi:hypothetical protein